MYTINDDKIDKNKLNILIDDNINKYKYNLENIKYSVIIQNNSQSS